MAALAPKETGLAGAVKIVVKTFLEQSHYQKLHELLSEEWSHCHSLTAAVRLMEAHGVYVTPEEEQRLAKLPEDRMIDALVLRMPQQSREQFEHFFLQLSLIASTTTRLRSALEAGNPNAVEEVMVSAENVGILQFILKMAVAQAGAEVKAHQQDHEDWLAVTSDRLAPLLQSQANAVISNKALAQAKYDLANHHTEANEKSKKFLANIAGNSSAALQAMSFHEWHEYIIQMKREAEIRVEYQEEIDAANQRLQDYIETQTATMKKMINKRSMATQEELVGLCFQSFVDELKDKANRIAKEAEMKALEERMSKFTADQSAKSKAVMGRMNAGSEDGLKSLCIQAWIQAMAEAKKNAEFEEAVKAEEAKLKAFQEKQKEGATGVLNRMSSASESGLLQTVLTAWIEVFTEQKKAYEMEELLAGAGGKFGSFSDKNKKGAMNITERAALAQDTGTLIVIFSYWKREMLVERMRRYAREKNNKKKQQLVGVKGLFKNFANELEAGLKEGTPRTEPPKSSAA
jgi:hypothetical protein